MTPIFICVSLFSVLSLSQARHSVGWSVDAAIASIYVMWPLAAGLAAADVVRLRRTGARALTEALPWWPATKLLWHRGIVVGAWTALGVLTATVVAALIAMAHGSTPSISALTPVLPGVLGAFALSMAGAAVGYALPAWPTPLALAVALYASWAFEIGGSSGLVDFVGATSGVIAAMHLSPPTVMAYLLIFAGILIAAGGFLAWQLVRSLKLGAVTLVGLLVSAGGWVWSSQEDTLRWTSDDGWPCTALAVGTGEVCVPPDQQRDLVSIAGALSPLVTRLSDLDAHWNGVDFSATRNTADDAVWIPLPFGQENLETTALADAIAGEVAPCLMSERDLGEEEAEQLSRALVTLGWWLVPDRSQDPFLLDALGLPNSPPSQEQALRAHVTLASCH